MDLLTVDQITLAALDVFENTLVALKTCSRKHESEFTKGAKIGDSLRIRKPAQFTVRDGQAWDGQNVADDYDTLTVRYQKGIDFSMSSRERKFTLNSMTDQILKPAIVRLANQVDADILQLAGRNTFNAVGTPGATPTALSTFLSAGKKLTNFACPRGKGMRELMIDADTEASMVDALKGFYQNQSKIASQYDTGEIGYVAGMNWNVDQNVYSHTTGTYAGSPLTNSAAAQSGASLITDGWTSGGAQLKEGDVFTISGVYAVNPVTKATLKDLMQFRVTADISDTTGAMTIPIAPAIVGPGSAQQNVSALPADNATITMFGATGTISPRNMLWAKEAITVAIIGLEKPDGVNAASVKYDEQSGVGLRYIEWYDGDTDLWKSRFDVVYGILMQRPEWACIVAA
jgi:hypothetical protein